MNRTLAALTITLAGCPDGLGTTATPDAPTPIDVPAAVDDTPVEVQALGVQGFVMRRGPDVVMTAPLFTRQSAIEVTFNVALAADTQAIDAGLAGVDLDDLSAIVTGHAHYDHLMDVPHVLANAPSATVYTNLSGRHMLAALAPDRPGCASAAPASTVARDRVVAVDDALASHVDYTNCPGNRPAGAPLEGSWIYVPGSRVRLMPFCAEHPPQVGPYHFGAGSVDADQCELPRAASDWLEGETLAFVIDFLDPAGAPVFRVFYQDAPTNAPVGHITSEVLSGKAVDLAILCVGTADAVVAHPAAIIDNVDPRFVLSGHWEDFFGPAGAAPNPQPFLDLAGYVARAEAALPGPADAPLVVDGAPSMTRHVLVQPGDRYVVPLAP